MKTVRDLILILLDVDYYRTFSDTFWNMQHLSADMILGGEY
jgi:hypothetical protein